MLRKSWLSNSVLVSFQTCDLFVEPEKLMIARNDEPTVEQKHLINPHVLHIHIQVKVVLGHKEPPCCRLDTISVVSSLQVKYVHEPLSGRLIAITRCSSAIIRSIVYFLQNLLSAIHAYPSVRIMFFFLLIVVDVGIRFIVTTISIVFIRPLTRIPQAEDEFAIAADPSRTRSTCTENTYSQTMNSSLPDWTTLLKFYVGTQHRVGLYQSAMSVEAAHLRFRVIT